MPSTTSPASTSSSISPSSIHRHDASSPVDVAARHGISDGQLDDVDPVAEHAAVGVEAPNDADDVGDETRLLEEPAPARLAGVLTRLAEAADQLDGLTTQRQPPRPADRQAPLVPGDADRPRGAALGARQVPRLLGTVGPAHRVGQHLQLGGT
jgi:hypothetical protein